MDDIEVTHNRNKATENKLPVVVGYIGGGILVLNALYLGLWGLGVLAMVFNMSIATGIIMLLTAVGFLPFAGMYAGFSSIGWIEEIRTDVSKFEFWTKVILVFIGGIVIPYIVYYLSSFIVLFIANFITSFVK